jgi:uncharacterized protein YdeI (YjbR/CyaY-like superfamily)
MTTHAEDFFTSGCGRCPLGGTPDCKVQHWQAVLVRLREIVLETGLDETCKYGSPFYTLGAGGANVVWIGVLKDYALVGFAKGALLADPQGILFQQTENVQAGRLLQFFDLEDVKRLENALREYIFEAIEIEKAGLKVQLKTTAEFEVPQEMEQKMAQDPAFRAAFEALTPGRQRGYLLHFAQPKQSKTRTERIEKWMPQIFMGRGLHDDYVQSVKKAREF